MKKWLFLAAPKKNEHGKMIFTYIEDFSQNMVQNEPAKKKLLGSKVEILAF